MFFWYSHKFLDVLDRTSMFPHEYTLFSLIFSVSNVFLAFSLDKNWRNYFTHIDNYFEYVLDDPGYQGRNQYII